LADIVDKGAFTGRVGYAHPTDAPASINRYTAKPTAMPRKACH
jgi:hypothetical protein